MNLAEDLRKIYDGLLEKFEAAEGNSAAAIAGQLRLIGEKLEQMEPSKETALVDELASRRSGAGRPPSRRRQSGRS